MEIKQIPDDNPHTTTEHQLQPFREDSAQFVHPDIDDWEDLLNPMMKKVFGCGEEEMRNSMKEMMHHGRYGLDGFVTCMHYFIVHCGLKGGMF